MADFFMMTFWFMFKHNIDGGITSATLLRWKIFLGTLQNLDWISETND